MRHHNRLPQALYLGDVGQRRCPSVRARLPRRSPYALLAKVVPCSHSRALLSRTMLSSSTTSSEAPNIIVAANQPADLPGRVSQLSAWTISPSKKGIVRQFTFPTFSAAWRFMSLVAEECKTKRHHPSWHNLYNQVTIEWTTHKPEGLSIKDVEMAELCDKMADKVGLRQDHGVGTAGPESSSPASH